MEISCAVSGLKFITKNNILSLGSEHHFSRVCVKLCYPNYTLGLASDWWNYPVFFRNVIEECEEEGILLACVVSSAVFWYLYVGAGYHNSTCNLCDGAGSYLLGRWFAITKLLRAATTGALNWGSGQLVSKNTQKWFFYSLGLRSCICQLILRDVGVCLFTFLF